MLLNNRENVMDEPYSARRARLEQVGVERRAHLATDDWAQPV